MRSGQKAIVGHEGRLAVPGLTFDLGPNPPVEELHEALEDRLSQLPPLEDDGFDRLRSAVAA